MAMTNQRIRDWASEERSRAAEFEAGFLEGYAVREFKNSPRNVSKILSSAGAEAGLTRHAINLATRNNSDFGAMTGPFDHGRVFGRDGEPLLIVGHPYELNRESMGIINAIRDLGLHVGVTGGSFYGFNTLRVLVVSKNYSKPERKTG